MHNIGDGIRRAGRRRQLHASRGAHLSFIHDDCVENDQLYTGVVEDSLLDGCYVAFSARPVVGRLGRRRTTTPRRSATTSSGSSRCPPSTRAARRAHGGFFKWDEHGRGPKLVIRDNVFRVDQRPNHQTLGLPAGYKVRVLEQRRRVARQGPVPRQAPEVLHA